MTHAAYAHAQSVFCVHREISAQLRLFDVRDRTVHCAALQHAAGVAKQLRKLEQFVTRSSRFFSLFSQKKVVFGDVACCDVEVSDEVVACSSVQVRSQRLRSGFAERLAAFACHRPGLGVKRGLTVCPSQQVKQWP